MKLENLKKAKELEARAEELEAQRSLIASMEAPSLAQFAGESGTMTGLPVSIWEEIKPAILAEMLTLINECYAEIEKL